MGGPAAVDLAPLPLDIQEHDPGHNEQHDTIHEIITRQGTLATRPAAGFAGRRYWATDVQREYEDDGATWWRVGAPRSEFDPIDYGAVGDGVTDDWPAFEAALDAMRALQVPGSDFYASRGLILKIRMPPGGVGYRLSATIHVDRSMVIEGEQGNGYYGWSILIWDAGVGIGIRVERSTTSADGGKGDWSVIRQLVLMNTATTTPGDVAIHMDARALIERNWITNWSSDLIYGDGATAGNNVDSIYIGFNRLDTSGGYGINVIGTNGNAGLIEHNDISDCALGRIAEDSFLGNTQIANAGQGCGTGHNTGVGHGVQASTLVGEYIEGGQPNTLGAVIIAVGGTWGDFPTYVAGTGLFGIQGKGNIVSGGLDIRQHNDVGGTMEWYAPPAGAHNIVTMRNYAGTSLGGWSNGGKLAIGQSPSDSLGALSVRQAASGLIGVFEGTALASNGQFVSVGFVANASTQGYATLKRYTETSTGILAGAFSMETPSGKNITLLPGGTAAVVVGNVGSAVGFYGSAGAVRGTVSGSRAGNAALASLITYLAARNLLVDGTSA